MSSNMAESASVSSTLILVPIAVSLATGLFFVDRAIATDIGSVDSVQFTTEVVPIATTYLISGVLMLTSEPILSAISIKWAIAVSFVLLPAGSTLYAFSSTTTLMAMGRSVMSFAALLMCASAARAVRHVLNFIGGFDLWIVDLGYIS
ncbi:hypothetical protein B0H13DRAFT_2439351 [Mycena leptocephala]|nr:hypothetical protein B0H13DRAFT_2439351 [Mycena leptocephala]